MTPMYLRVATIEDARLLFDWRNDATVRAMSVNSDPVDWDGHVAWLTERLARLMPNLYIAMKDETPVGTVRTDGLEISYTVAPEHRGKGIATEMLAISRKNHGARTAKIKRENVASIRAAQKAGHKVELI